MIDTLLRMWESQPVMIVVWSFMCFILGNVFCATCYWYRISAVIKKAAHHLEQLQSCPPGEAPHRRSTDLDPSGD